MGELLPDVEDAPVLGGHNRNSKKTESIQNSHTSQESEFEPEEKDLDQAEHPTHLPSSLVRVRFDSKIRLYPSKECRQLVWALRPSQVLSPKFAGTFWNGPPHQGFNTI